jgi:hypothetical protein
MIALAPLRENRKNAPYPEIDFSMTRIVHGTSRGVLPASITNDKGGRRSVEHH